MSQSKQVMEDADRRPEEFQVSGQAGPAKVRVGLAHRRLVEGAYYLWHEQIVELLAAQSQCRVFIRERDTGDVHVVDPVHLQPFALPDTPPGTEHDVGALGVTRADWDRARRRQSVIGELLKAPRITAASVHRAAERLCVSPRQVHRLIARYNQSGGFDALLRKRTGPPQGRSMLEAESRAALEHVTRKRLRRSANSTVMDIFHAVKSECGRRKIPAPSMATVARYFHSARRSPDFLPPPIRKVMREKTRGVKQHFEVQRPLQTVQIDHTVADVLIVDVRDHLVIGRPVVTLALDLNTRCILGVNISLEAPGILSVALCLTHAVNPKDAWLRSIGCHGQWPVFGIPEQLHMDNGREFHSSAFLLGCDKYNINVRYRPPGTPRFGGAVERVIGTFMRRVRLLPGATYSDILKQRPPHPEREATFTLEDIKLYLANEINRYHHTTHSTLGVTPLTAWERAWRGDGKALIVPPRPQDPLQFLLAFLPLKMRIVGREGINLFGLEYYSAELASYISSDKQRAVRFDPRDLSQVYVEVAQHHTLIVPLRDCTLPRLSLFEWREIRRRDLARVKDADASEIARSLQENWELIEAGATRLRQRRRRERQRHWEAQPPLGHDLTPPQPDPQSSDDVEFDDLLDVLSFELPE